MGEFGMGQGESATRGEACARDHPLIKLCCRLHKQTKERMWEGDGGRERKLGKIEIDKFPIAG